MAWDSECTNSKPRRKVSCLVGWSPRPRSKERSCEIIEKRCEIKEKEEKENGMRRKKVRIASGLSEKW